MVYIISTLIRKAFKKADKIREAKDFEDLWKILMLTPLNYGKEALFDETTRKIMEKIEF